MSLHQRTNSLIRHMNEGDAQAREELIRRTAGRLRYLTGEMLKTYPDLRRRIDGDDFFQEMMLGLIRDLNGLLIKDHRHFFQLAAKMFRRDLIDLALRYRGPRVQTVDHEYQVPPDDRRGPANEAASLTDDPVELAVWTDLHEKVETLTIRSRAILDLMYYQGLSATKAALTLGYAPETARRHWRLALIELHEAMGGHLPEL